MNLDEYPKDNTEVVVQGVFETYEEEGYFKCMSRKMQVEYEIKMQEFMKKAGCNFVLLFPNQEC